MIGYYLLKRIHALSGKKVLIEVPFPTEKSHESPGRIAVIVHCFYLDLFDELLDYISRIPYPHRLFVSTDTREKQNIITEKLRGRKVPHFEVRLAVNRGRDIAPKYITFRDVYAECDYFLHLHGKKSPHLGEAWGNRWRKYLLDSLLGSPEIVASIFAILRDGRIGLVFPDPYDPNLPQLRWSANYEVSLALANKLGIEISKDYCPEYPAGSMFWAKASIVRPLLDLNLRFDDFPPEKGRVDGELSHAIERMIVPVTLAQGLHGQRIITEKLKRSRKSIRVKSAAQLPEAVALCLRNEGP
jgi:lipopolysaccharide biosynthesis protein